MGSYSVVSFSVAEKSSNEAGDIDLLRERIIFRAIALFRCISFSF